MPRVKKPPATEPPAPQAVRAPRRGVARIGEVPQSERALSTAQSAVQREVAAQCIAKGMTQDRAATEAGVVVRTVAGWCTQQDFRDRIAVLRSQAFEELEADIWANVRLALDLERRVFNGEVKADDPAWLEAKPHLTGVRNLLLKAAAPDAAAGTPGVNIFVGGDRAGREVEPERPAGRIIEHE